MPLKASRMIEKNRGTLSPFTAIIMMLRELVKRRDGAVAIIFGLAAIPAVIAAGMAIDVGRASMVKIRLGAALDAAALAVGSETNRTQTQLTTDLQNYFTANYPSSAVGTNVTVSTVPANADLTASTVTFQAQATVPMTFMQLAGVSSINVTVTAQTKKTSGLEVAVVLDNTGSMLCGPNDGAPSYSDSACGGNVVASDTSCTNSSNQSRICTLINAATQFVNTLTSAVTSSQQLYISIVPYVTTVNIGDSFCSGATTCSNISCDQQQFYRPSRQYDAGHSDHRYHVQRQQHDLECLDADAKRLGFGYACHSGGDVYIRARHSERRDGQQRQ
jgi:Flp pilus assembly protein TadG